MHGLLLVKQRALAGREESGRQCAKAGHDRFGEPFGGLEFRQCRQSFAEHFHGAPQPGLAQIPQCNQPFAYLRHGSGTVGHRGADGVELIGQFPIELVSTQRHHARLAEQVCPFPGEELPGTGMIRRRRGIRWVAGLRHFPLPCCDFQVRGSLPTETRMLLGRMRETPPHVRAEKRIWW